MKNVIKCFAATLAALIFSLSQSSAEHNIIDKEKYPELYCLALNIYFEARGESLKGQFAVADVTLNRVESSEFPDTICQVVYQPSQFSWTNSVSNPRNPRLGEKNAWFDAQIFAIEIFRWNIMRGITDGATYFHASYSRPYWRNIFEKTKKIGSHLFYIDPTRN